MTERYCDMTAPKGEAWCVLCGQCHAFGTKCDPARLAWIAERCRELDVSPSSLVRAIKNLESRSLIQ